MGTVGTVGTAITLCASLSASRASIAFIFALSPPALASSLFRSARLSRLASSTPATLCVKGAAIPRVSSLNDKTLWMGSNGYMTVEWNQSGESDNVEASQSKPEKEKEQSSIVLI
jgi:hypothetical protein